MNAHQALRAHVANNTPLIIDGGMGTELKNRGAFPCLREYQQLWSAAALVKEESRKIVVDAHVAFIEAGAELIITNTYACTPEILGKRGLDDRLEELIDVGCTLAKSAREKAGKPDTLIAGSMPPVGVTYRPDLSPDETVLRSTYERIAAALAPHVDLFLCETVSSILEAEVAASVAKKYGKPVWVACVLDQPKPRATPVQSSTRGTKRVKNSPSSKTDDLLVTLRSGESILDYAKALDVHADALLFNCSTPEATTIAIGELRRVAPHMPCGAYANHFQPVPTDWVLDAEEEGGGLLTIRGDLTPENYTEYGKRWRELGAVIIGGCCGITPAHIAHLSKTLAVFASGCVFEFVSAGVNNAIEGKGKRFPLVPRQTALPTAAIAL
jgi:S-methylmethionine-dependent homocysteine/selenocysteine methylase